jgi:hypothetical protein
MLKVQIAVGLAVKFPAKPSPQAPPGTTLQ